MRRFQFLIAIGCIFLFAACGGPPDKAKSAAELALADAQAKSECAQEKFAAAQKLFDEAQQLVEEKEYDAAERKFNAAEKLAKQAQTEAEANWEECQRRKMAKNTGDEAADEEQQEEEPRATLKVVHFDYDSADIASSYQAILRENARWLEQNPDSRLIIEGHTDNRGSNEYNIALGERRAAVVKKFLINLGIDASRLDTISYGEEKPAAFGETPSDHGKNRRAEFLPKN